ncbi:hypothetical protein AFCDBAGC_3499 [Methylobacterium cerastii]|uniref:DUF4112 domain-containing protein n=1 Tax=Methylobacterium cerastii TaxID=932741 RepID=A0ABQ4QLC9_9HYPH|nr:hypothetical protein [Methylobacterium cerastii]GJD45625.1 hypothetical protein AFCDBAGC_3499 [Methylobacterium cerastii]
MQISADLFTLRTLPETVLIGPRAAFGRGHRHALQSDDALHRCLSCLCHDPGAMQRLRRAFERWGGGTGFTHASDGALFERVIADTRRGRLAAWVVPNGEIRDLRQPDVERSTTWISQGTPLSPGEAPGFRATRDQGAARIAAHTVRMPPRPVDVGPRPGTSPVRLDVAGMTIEVRLTEILRRAIRSDRLTAEMAAQLQAMIAPAEIAKTVAVLAVWAGSHAVGIGFFVDLLLGSSLFFLGWGVLEAPRKLKKFVEIAAAAKTEAELDLAADFLAAVIVTVGIRVIQAAIRRGSVRLTSGRQGRSEGGR